MTRLAARVGLLGAGLLLTFCAASASGAPGGGPGRLVFATSGDGVSGRLEIAAVRPDGRGMTRLTRHTPSGAAPRWTRDGRRIMFVTWDSLTDRGGYWQMRSDGTKASQLPGDPNVNWPPSPSGRLAAVAGRRGIAIVTATGRRIRTLPFRLRATEFFDGPLAWTGDERRIAVNVVDEDAGTMRVFVLRVDGKAPPRALTPKDRYEYALSWSPDGRSLAVDTAGSGEYTTIVRVPADGGRRRLLAFDAAASGEHAWSSDSTRLAYVGRGGGVYVVPTATGRSRRVARTRLEGTREARNIGIAWSPVRGELAFSDVDGLHIVRVAGGRHRITRRGARSDPAWSPDGSRITFSENGEIFVVRREGNGLRAITHAVHDDSPKPSPDGSRIAFIRGAPGFVDPATIDVYVAGRSGKGVRRVGHGYGPEWSPDGRRLAFVDVTSSGDAPEATKLRAGRIMVWDAATGMLRQVAVGTAPTWTADGLHLAFMRYTFDLRVTWRGASVTVTSSSLWVVGVDGSAPRKLLDPPEPPEGRRPLYYRPVWSPRTDSVALIEYSSVWVDDEGEWSTRAAVALLDVGTGLIRRLDAAADELAWSPDGTRLLLGKSYEIAVADVATGAVQTVVPDREATTYGYAVWSPTGAQVAFVAAEEEKGADVYVVGADGTGRTRVTRTAGVEGALAWSSR